MEVTDDYVTMLTPEGEFVKTRTENRQYEIGQEMSFFPFRVETVEATRFTSKRKTWKPLFVSTLAVAMVLLFLVPYYMQQQVYAYMSIDINPSLELGVNRDYEVVDLKAFNEEGEKLIKTLSSWEHQSVHDVTTALLNASKKQGYLKETNEVLITTVVKKKEKSYEKRLSTDIQQIQNEWKSYTFETVRTSTVTREEAMTRGVSTGAVIREKQIKETDNLAPSSQREDKSETSSSKSTKQDAQHDFSKEAKEDKLNGSSPAYARPNEDKSKNPPAHARPNEDKSKGPPAHARPNEGQPKGPPAHARPNEDKPKGPPAHARPNEDKPKNPPAHARPNEDKPKNPPVHARPNEDKPKGPPAHARPNEEKSKGGPSAHAKSNEEKQKGPPPHAKQNHSSSTKQKELSEE